jgi:hypothetical protein
MNKKLVDYIAYALSNKPLAYQLGFLQAHLAQIMLKDSREIDKFKAKIQQIDQDQKPTNKQ